MVTEKEKQYFDQLNKDYMSDESDSADSKEIIVHKHQKVRIISNSYTSELNGRISISSVHW